VATDHRRRNYEHIEGPEAAKRFDSSMRQIVTVTKEELTRREAAYQKTRHPKKTRRPAK
jgi:hypothetical protein